MNLKTGSIIDIYDSLSEASELVNKHPEWTIMVKYKDRQCVYDGAELGSTGVVVKWSLPDDRVQINKLNANENFAPSNFALAA